MSTALHQLNSTELFIIRHLARKPIVRPTFASILGNINEVVTARCWIPIALQGSLDADHLAELRDWIATFDEESVISGWREVNLRGRRTMAGEELVLMMRSAEDIQRKMNLRFNACFRCGIAI